MYNRDLKTRLKTVLSKTLEQHGNKNIPIVYRDSSCVKKNQFIHVYPNGRKVLVQQNPENSAEKIIKEF